MHHSHAFYHIRRANYPECTRAVVTMTGKAALSKVEKKTREHVKWRNKVWPKRVMT